jgi:hypothetical protein
MDVEVSTHTFLTMIIEECVFFMSCEPIFLLQLFLCGTHGKVSTENDNNFGYEKITILVDNIPLTKINCITLKICSKADFKSKSQNIVPMIADHNLVKKSFGR